MTRCWTLKEESMTKLYLSFLGTNPYVTCTYYRNKQVFRNVRFVQQATIKMNCLQWGPEDRVRIFTTDEAFKKNWVDHGHEADADGPYYGLGSRLAAMRLNADVRHVGIPEGQSEDGIWEIFRRVYDEMRPEDDVYLDITHALRSIPLLAHVVLTYAKVLKGISVEGVHYGAFEILGFSQTVREIPLEKRRAPIFDLTPLDSLHDWGVAIDRFIVAGDASLACRLAKKGVTPLLASSKGQNEAAAGIRRVSSCLESMSESIRTCRAPDIALRASALKAALETCDAFHLLPAFRPLLERLSLETRAFTNDQVRDGIQAAHWCLEHNLVQQGLTILHETLITYCLSSICTSPMETKAREAVVPTARFLCSIRGKRESDANSFLEKLEASETLRALLGENVKLAKLIVNIANVRNNLNHAGYLPQPIRPARFKRALAYFLQRTDEVLS